MKFEVVWTTQFKRDYKNAIKRGYQIELLDDVIRKLAKGETLPERYKGPRAYRKLGWIPRVPYKK